MTGGSDGAVRAADVPMRADDATVVDAAAPHAAMQVRRRAAALAAAMTVSDEARPSRHRAHEPSAEASERLAEGDEPAAWRAEDATRAALAAEVTQWAHAMRHEGRSPTEAVEAVIRAVYDGAARTLPAARLAVEVRAAARGCLACFGEG